MVNKYLYECATCQFTFVTEEICKTCPECDCESLLVDGDDDSPNSIFNFKCLWCNLELATSTKFSFCPTCGTAANKDKQVHKRDNHNEGSTRRTIVIDIGPNFFIASFIVFLTFSIKGCY